MTYAGYVKFNICCSYNLYLCNFMMFCTCYTKVGDTNRIDFVIGAVIPCYKSFFCCLQGQFICDFQKFANNGYQLLLLP